MEGVGVAEEPHGIFSNDLILDLILSSLDGKSQLTARLVCRKWNDRILANFYKKLALRLKGDEEPAAVRKRLRDVDSRLLSSLKFLDRLNRVGLARVFRGVVESLVFGGLRSLHFLPGFGDGDDKKLLDCFIKIANSGVLCNLEELVITVGFCVDKKSVKALRSNAFPKMKHLCLTALVERCCISKGLQDWKAGFLAADYLKTFKSFLTSAPNLQSLETNIAFDLSGLKNLKTLGVKVSKLFTEEEVNMMIKSSRSSLISLNLRSCFYKTSLLELPMFPNLTTLEIRACSPLVDWTRFPKLENLTLEAPHDVWDNPAVSNSFPVLIDDLRLLPGNVRELWLTGFREELLESIGRVTRLNAPSLVLELTRWWSVDKISELFRMLREVNIELDEPTSTDTCMEKLSKKCWDVVRIRFEARRQIGRNFRDAEEGNN